jgi:hypothetical protein
MSGDIQNIMLASIIGDALGSPMDGLGRGHIRSHFKNMTDYADPAPGLKGKIELWRKPGLYSSMSQFMLILALACRRRGPCSGEFCRSIAASPEVSACDYGIFRCPDTAEKRFILGVKDAAGAAGPQPLPGARVLPVLVPLALRNNSTAELITDVIGHVRLFTRDLPTLSASLLYAKLLGALAREKNSRVDPLAAARETIAALHDEVETHSSAVFAMAVNPGSLADEIAALEEILSGIGSAGAIPEAETIICSFINRKLKSPVTRATVNMPAALLPYAIALCSLHHDPGSLLFTAVMEGGSTAPLTALTAGIGACLHGSDIIPPSLLQNLVNRKRILSLVHGICGGSPQPGLLDDFFMSEASLTAKEQEELRSKLKHTGKKPKKKIETRKDMEMKLTRHVVESWTKMDKAKWKKERKQRDKSEES